MEISEAIYLLDNLIGMVDDNHHPDYGGALHMAIEALKQEPSRAQELKKMSEAPANECDRLAREYNDYNDYIYKTINKTSPKSAEILQKEMIRQESTVELIASENFPSDSVLAACGSVMSNKYTEGYPGKRYYGGCENFDELERYGEEVFKKCFNTDYHINLQPHSGSSANCIAYSSILRQGDTILAMGMNCGAHLTHSSTASFVSKLYYVETYGTANNGIIDYEDLEEKTHEYNPDAIVCGASAYPREIDFRRIREICDKCGAYMIADIAHISALVVSGDHKTPFGLADIVTMTTQKTFRGPRGGVIACKPEFSKRVDAACFPRWQGGALQNQIMGKVIAAEEALKDEFKEYAHQVVKNAQAMAEEFIRLGYKITTGGTDTHLFVIDFSETHPNLTGKAVQNHLEQHGITVNKNCVPGEKRSPQETSGIRIGLAAMTTKGWTEADAIACAQLIDYHIKELE